MTDPLPEPCGAAVPSDQPQPSDWDETEMAASHELSKNVRADARRNRARVLEAAEAAFGSEGLSVPIDDIARRAGVGVGTIYRHFPTKEALFEAIVLSHFERVLDEADRLAACEEPVDALFGFMGSLVREAVTKRDLADALAGAGFDVKAAASSVMDDLETAISELLVRAQACGTVRGDVTVTDLMGLISGACMAAERQGDPSSPGRMLDVVCEGLRQHKM